MPGAVFASAISRSQVALNPWTPSVSKQSECLKVKLAVAELQLPLEVRETLRKKLHQSTRLIRKHYPISSGCESARKEIK